MKLLVERVGCAQNGHRGFLIAAAQPNPGFLNWNTPNRPLATSTYRPHAVFADCAPMRSVGRSWGMLFGQHDIPIAEVQEN